jgi:hypothetical protein
MNELRKYLIENRDIFDDLEPSEGHLERFAERLNARDDKQPRKSSLKRRLTLTFALAASVALIVAVGIWSLSKHEPTTSNINEFAETESFYQAQMDEQIEAILCKLDKADPETRRQLDGDLRDIIEENRAFLDEIRNQTDRELAIYYLVEHYNVNLETLQSINDRLGEYFSC